MHSQTANSETVVIMFVAASLTALFKHIGSTDDRSAEDLTACESIREKVLSFIRDKVRHF